MIEEKGNVSINGPSNAIVRFTLTFINSNKFEEKKHVEGKPVVRF